MTGQSDQIFGGQFTDRQVLVTGHSGFKGGWISTWLNRLGAQVTGIALPPEPGPSFYQACGLDRTMDSRFADIRDPAALARATEGLDAEVVFHMAAQPLVRKSYREPAETFATNVQGTVNVLEAVRRMPSLKAVVVITSDKCYDNREWLWGYRENDPLGGKDPYSASKAATELVAQSYAHSFFSDANGPQLSTVRAGNVFGGGDWGEDRLIPDIIRAWNDGQPVTIRNPDSVRPWQHVLEPVAGYLLLAQKILSDGQRFAGAWNFGPNVSGTVNVRDLADMMWRAWGAGAPGFRFPDESATAPHEAGILRLDSTKAQTRLGWRPRLELSQAVELTTDWYKAHATGDDMGKVTQSQIAAYQDLMSGTGCDQTGLAAQ
ncbi:CDP-glucose 4,6-dehydratase [Ruegeria arenilitoris]|uniref:CDP-glucose 4,6-dehydratase n=1 Tax=Ruegeria arenilitoris TaxID=1173585 RepID=UPI00147A00B3|nr:CDP-glucose 4,6-dehydratase [Ruegeria arenilitoris]